MKVPDLEEWVDRELNGYGDQRDGIPDYRKGNCHAFGNFRGFAHQLNNSPIPSLLLKPDDRHWAESSLLREPVTVYADLVSDPSRHEFICQWPANLIGKYQSTFYGRDFLLQDAWQSLSRGQIFAVVEAVRNRVLKFALELERTFPATDKLPESLESKDRDAATQLIQTIIYGNVANYAAGGTNLNQSSQVISGDFESLKSQLLAAGVDEGEIPALQKALERDGNRSDGKPGKNTTEWFGHLCAKAAQGVGQIAVSTAGTIIPKLLGQYLGLPPG
jgi:hypothetical protein